MLGRAGHPHIGEAAHPHPPTPAGRLPRNSTLCATVVGGSARPQTNESATAEPSISGSQCVALPVSDNLGQARSPRPVPLPRRSRRLMRPKRPAEASAPGHHQPRELDRRRTRRRARGARVSRARDGSGAIAASTPVAELQGLRERAERARYLCSRCRRLPADTAPIRALGLDEADRAPGLGLTIQIVALHS
jgi:hypothetical protein